VSNKALLCAAFESVQASSLKGGFVSNAADALDDVKTMLALAPHSDLERSSAALTVTVQERRPGWQLLDLGELWRYRELLYFLTWRDIKVRYKQTVLGAAWAILQPLATMLVFSLFFGKVAGNPSSTVPYPLFVLARLGSLDVRLQCDCPGSSERREQPESGN
jgi:hypothetical protein